MTRGVDITGQRFGHLTAIERAVQSRNGTWKWRCKCDCGTEKVVFVTALHAGTTISCGCQRGKNGTHGKTNTPTYRTWKSMKARCWNPKSPDFKLYGGRGITVCERWFNSFEAFLADMGERPAGHTLDRKNANGNYEPNNCRWATPKEQARNRRKKEGVLCHA